MRGFIKQYADGVFDSATISIRNSHSEGNNWVGGSRYRNFAETPNGDDGKEREAIQDSIINKLYYIVCRVSQDHPPNVPC